MTMWFVPLLARLTRLTHLARRDRGQTTAEYALVLLGVAALALLVLAWAASSGKVGQLLDAVFDSLISNVT